MNTATVTDLLNEARTMTASLRAALTSSTTKKQTRTIAEDLEFWSNRAAFLANAVITSNVATLVVAGATPIDALRTVCGAETVDTMISNLYDTLRAGK